jgi:serine/threonine protein phosphatase PrpC
MAPRPWGGDAASRIAVETVLRQFSVAPGCSPGTVFSLIDQANRDVISQQGNSNDTADMRATLVVLVFNATSLEAVWGHIGDSRLYCFRSGFVVNRTKDHSLFQSMVDAGFADPERLRGNPERSVLIASLGAIRVPARSSAARSRSGGDAF